MDLCEIRNVGGPVPALSGLQIWGLEHKPFLQESSYK